MRHRKEFNQLGRKSSHRRAMLSNMANSLIHNKRIVTTVAKAKALRCYIEPILTKSKNDTTHSRRIVFSHLKNKFTVSELFREITPKISERNGGYTRIIKTGFRKGDASDMAMIELVDYNLSYKSKGSNFKAKTTTRKRRRGKSKKTSDQNIENKIVEKQTKNQDSTDEKTIENLDVKFSNNSSDGDIKKEK